MVARADTFTTVRTLGGLLPVELLERIRSGDRSVEGLTADAYHLLPGEQLREAISRSWIRLTGPWASFRAAAARLPEGDAGTTLTRERWLLVLFGELGYGRLPTARGLSVDGQAYPVSHAWGPVPIHLAGAGVDLDARTAGVAGAARSAPHSMVQELLNRSDEHLWGLVSNGLLLRVLRDNAAMTRQAFVEFDLQAMMDGDVYADFVLLWLLCHQSRLEGSAPGGSRAGDRPQACWLERWAQTAERDGTRARDRLRDGVERALTVLGSGFLAEPGNDRLRSAFHDGALDAEAYYRELLRLVYRLLFLFVAEDRDLLLVPAGDTKPEPRERYERYYSTRRLRDLAGRQVGSRHGDLWVALRLVFGALGSDEGCADLALPPLGGFLWRPDATPSLDAAALSNGYLLEAVRALAWIEQDRRTRAVDYRNLGADEFGSVYESLLELHPSVDVFARRFALGAGAGSERKTTGSYYTPTPLISQLLDTALEPVLDEAARESDPEAAILALKVVDPAVGSGHFLLAAANRMARRLAQLRTGEGEPTPDATQRALRDVVSRCLYGVDLNPMALELAKVSLWLEGHVPGRPLTFLDHHLKQGNSLLGTTPALVARGIPDAAFKPLEGDDKVTVTALRKRNARLRGGQGELLLAAEEHGVYDVLGPVARALSAADDSTIKSLHDKERRFRELEQSVELRLQRLLADAWCAAFVAPKVAGAPQPLEAFYRLRDGQPAPADAVVVTERLAIEYDLFHWHLAFPDVFTPSTDAQPDDPAGWRGGFDVVIGNPPWERIKLQEQEFFAARDPEIATAPNAAARKRMIAALAIAEDPLHRAFAAAKRRAEGASHLVRNSGRYPLCGRGDINTYAIFAETNRTVLGPTGRAGFIVPSGIATDSTTKDFFGTLVKTGTLTNLYSFENEEHIFPAVHHSTKFSLITISGPSRSTPLADFIFFARRPTDISDTERRFPLTTADIALLNPNTRTCPIFRTRRDAEITKAIYRRVPVLVDENKPDGNPWGITFSTMFHMSNDSGLFRTRPELEALGWTLDGNLFARGNARYLPLYEAKMLHHYDHRLGTYEGQTEKQANLGTLPRLSDADHADPSHLPLPRYWVPEVEVDARLADRWPHNWLLGWRKTCRATDERTLISAPLPVSGVGDKYQLLLSAQLRTISALLGNLDSFISDFAVRQKLGGTDLSFYILRQLPVLPPASYDESAPWDLAQTLTAWLTPRVVELSYAAWDLQPFAADLGYDGPPFRWDPNRRFLLRCELDAAFFHLYGIERDDVDYIMDTFPIVRRKDQTAYGTYRTKHTILDFYDAMTKATATGDPYETRLVPPPADESCRHPGKKEASA